MPGDQAGDDVTLRLRIVPDGGAPADDSTVATVEARLDDGTTRTPTAYPDDGDRSEWSAPLAGVAAGLWEIVWTVRGTGSGVTRYRLPVGPASAVPAPGRVYATTGQLAAALDGPPPDNALLLLRRASREVDRWTVTAIYDVDAAGLPTDPRVAQAMADAVCAQVAWWDEIGDEGSGAATVLAGAQIGSVRLPGGSTGATSTATPTAPPGCAPGCWSALQAAGLTSQGPRIPGPHPVVIRQSAL